MCQPFWTKKVQLSCLPLFCKGETGLPAVRKPPPRQLYPLSRENDPLSTLRRVAPGCPYYTPSMPAPGRGGPTLPAAPISQTRTAGRDIPAHILPTTGTHTLPTTADSTPRPPSLSPLARHNPCHHAEAPSLPCHRCSTWNNRPPCCNCIPSCHATLPPPCHASHPGAMATRATITPPAAALASCKPLQGAPRLPRPPTTGPIPPRSPRKDTPLSGAALLLGNMGPLILLGPLFWDSGDGTGLQRGTLHLERDS